MVALMHPSNQFGPRPLGGPSIGMDMETMQNQIGFNLQRTNMEIARANQEEAVKKQALQGYGRIAGRGTRALAEFASPGIGSKVHEALSFERGTPATNVGTTPGAGAPTAIAGGSSEAGTRAIKGFLSGNFDSAHTTNPGATPAGVDGGTTAGLLGGLTGKVSAAVEAAKVGMKTAQNVQEISKGQIRGKKPQSNNEKIMTGFDLAKGGALALTGVGGLTTVANVALHAGKAIRDVFGEDDDSSESRWTWKWY